ncbi:MAG: extracellular solute-binding protein [Chloroflexi bacterium]|nr:extracellular solute-binding protein [Chloroflexota bacterium]
MKRTTRLLIGALFVLSTLLAAAGCAKAPEAQKLTIWINGRDSFIGPNEQQLPQDQWYISQAIKRFEEANPGVTVELVVQADAYAAHQMFRTTALAGNAPDIANLWAGQFIFALEDAITPITDKIPQADKDTILGWDTDTVGFTAGNPILGYPTPDNQLCFFLYNKKIVQEVGLDFEANPPRTMDDFYATMEKIKNAGYIPIGADEAVDGYAYYFFQIAAYWWVQQNGFDPILAEDRGEANFADDQALLTALEAYQEIWAKGYMNQDAATSSDSWNKFLQGKIAMVPRVSSFVKDAQDALGVENVGVIIPPDISDTAVIKNGTIGGPGQVMVVSKNSTNVDLAIKFMSFLNSKAEVLELNKFQTKVPIRTDVTPTDLGAEPGTALAKLIEWSGNYVFWVDNSLSGPVVDDFNKLLPLVLTGKMTPLELAQQLDKDKGAQ